MLRIYDRTHSALGYIRKYKDLKIESDVSTGEKTLYFTHIDPDEMEILPEFYVETQDDEYVVKEKNASSGGFPEYVCSLNLEDLQQTQFATFQITDSTIEDAVKLALAGTGWTIETCEITKKRNAGMMNVTPLGAIEKLCTAFMCERTFDTKKKTVSFYETVGEDRGVYFLRSLNLKKISSKSDTYNFYTRIVPTGADGLTIADVNDGKEYLENYQYSSKILTYYWEDESYTDADALKEDAELMLEELSSPAESYSAEILDLAKQSARYSVLSFGLGDKIRLIDVRLGIKKKQRIVKLTEYPDAPWKNTCELGNAVLTFSELQEKYQAATEIINTVVSSDGRYKGTISVSDILGFEEGVSSSNAVTTIENELDSIKLKVGDITANYLTAEQAALKYATVEELKAIDATIKNLDTVYADIDFANVGTAAMETFYANSGLIKDVTIENQTLTGELIGVTIKGNLIEADTIAAEKLIVKGEDGLYYRLNADGATTKAEQTEYNSLNGKVIIAESITADKINVSDLVAFGATIGGFHISEDAIYSGAKESIDNTTNGVYLGDDGQIAFGDSVSYVKYYADAKGDYHLTVAAESFLFSASGKNVEDEIGEAKKTATDYMSYDAENGLLIGDRSSGSWSGTRAQITADGYNILDADNAVLAAFGSTATIGKASGQNVYIDSDSVDIRDGTDALASFAADEIVLGTETAKISLCGGQGAITMEASDPDYPDALNMLRIYTDNYMEIQSGQYLTLDTGAFYILDDDSEAGAAVRILGTLTVLNASNPNSALLRVNPTDGVSAIGNITASSAVYASNWFRSYGATGWYSETFGGGIYMYDTEWVRTYNNKNFYSAGQVRGGTLYAEGDADVEGDLTVIGNIDAGLLTVSSTTTGIDTPLQVESGGCVQIQGSYANGSAFRPIADGGRNLGNSSYRWKKVYAKDSTISTSDEREKDILDSGIDERYEKLFTMLKPIAYRWKDADEGDTGIRLGIGAQTTEASAREAGLSADEFTAVTHDALEETSALGLNDRYGVDYQQIGILTLLMAQKCVSEIKQIKKQLSAGKEG